MKQKLVSWLVSIGIIACIAVGNIYTEDVIHNTTCDKILCTTVRVAYEGAEVYTPLNLPPWGIWPKLEVK